MCNNNTAIELNSTGKVTQSPKVDYVYEWVNQSVGTSSFIYYILLCTDLKEKTYSLAKKCN